MKNIVFLLPALFPSLAVALPAESANYQLAARTVDSGGSHAGSASYAIDASAGGFTTGTSAAVSSTAVRNGYAGQLYEIAGLELASVAATVAEEVTLQLAARLILDDTTFLAVPPDSVAWSVLGGPLASIDAEGLVTAATVFQVTAASVEGNFAAWTGVLDLTVLDTIPDNFGAYAGDGIGDDWQFLHFGEDNPDAGPGLDPDGDGQDNEFEFTAGLIPTDPLSRFALRIEPVAGEPTRRALVFGPRVAGSSYGVLASSGLDGVWLPLGASSTVDDGEQRTVVDLEATEARKFYRVEITRP